MQSLFATKEVDIAEIITLQDNYIEMTAQDNSAVIQRASALRQDVIASSILAEHGFSVLLRTAVGENRHTVLFDFGFSADGAARNASMLGAPLQETDCMVLSHGHSDHTGGILALAKMIGKEGLPLFCHPGVFRANRYLEPVPEFKAYFPALSRERLLAEGIHIRETAEPCLLPGKQALFLGEIPRRTDFEKGFPIAYRDTDGGKEWDPIEDDTSVVINLRDKGLIVISGCAHAGIVNTLIRAKELTGIQKIHAVIGGFHLSGPLFEPILDRTVDELLSFEPEYVVPCHCTGRRSVARIEQRMPEQFLFNMSGTKLTFSSAP